MESTAILDFNAFATGQLSFSKGDMLKILQFGEEPNWYKAELDGKEGYVPSKRIDFKVPDWYRRVSRQDAEELLLKTNDKWEYIQPDGAFLVRKSESSPIDFGLSVKFGDQVQHRRILRDGVGYYFLWVVKFLSINQLVKYHRTSSVSRKQELFLVDMVEETYIAMYNYTPQDSEEIELHIGDQVTKDYVKSCDWWFGKNKRTGRTGRYSPKYVKHA